MYIGLSAQSAGANKSGPKKAKEAQRRNNRVRLGVEGIKVNSQSSYFILPDFPPECGEFMVHWRPRVEMNWAVMFGTSRTYGRPFAW